MATAKKTAATKKAAADATAPLLPHIGPATDTNVPYPGVAPIQITNPANTAPLTDKETAVKMFEKMCTIRFFEESVKKDFLNGEIPGFDRLKTAAQDVVRVLGVYRDQIPPEKEGVLL